MNNTTKQPQTCYVSISVEDRLPEDDELKFVETTLTDNETAFYEDGKWESDLRGYEEPESVTHWLEKKDSVYIFTPEELEALLQKERREAAEKAWAACMRWKDYYESEGATSMSPDKQTYLDQHYPLPTIPKQ